MSMLFDPLGRIMTESHGKEEMLLADFKADLLAHERSKPDIGLRTRRPEIYDELTT